MDSGNMSEVEIEGVQPGEVVATDLEATDTPPQVEETEQPLVYIEDEGDQQEEPKSGMDEAQLRAAMREEREKRKRKNAELEAAKKEKQELEERLARAEKLAFEAAVGKKPNPSDYLDATDYDQALSKYNEMVGNYSPKQAESAKQEEQSQSGIQLSEDQELHAYKTRAELRQFLPDYDEAEARIDNVMRQAGLNVEQVKSSLIALTALHGIDYAKAVYALDRIPSLRDELGRAPNELALAQVMKKAADKVKVNHPQKIDTKPEPELTSSGAVHASAQMVEKLREKWAETGSAADYKALSEARKKLKEQANG